MENALLCFFKAFIKALFLIFSKKSQQSHQLIINPKSKYKKSFLLLRRKLYMFFNQKILLFFCEEVFYMIVMNDIFFKQISSGFIRSGHFNTFGKCLPCSCLKCCNNFLCHGFIFYLI